MQADCCCCCFCRVDLLQEAAVTDEQLALQAVISKLPADKDSKVDYLGVIEAFSAASARLRLWLRWPLEHCVGTASTLQASAARQLCESNTGHMLLDQVAQRLGMYGQGYTAGGYLPRFPVEVRGSCQACMRLANGNAHANG